MISMIKKIYIELDGELSSNELFTVKSIFETLPDELKRDDDNDRRKN